MKKFITLFTVALALIVLGTSCQQITSVGLEKEEREPDATSAVFYFFDALTGQPIEFVDSDKVTISFGGNGVKTLTGKESAIGKVEVGSGAVSVKNFAKKDNFSITVKKDGYYDFISADVFDGKKDIREDSINLDGTSDSQTFFAFIFSEAIEYTTQELKFTVRDSETKEAVESGRFIVEFKGSISPNLTGGESGTYKTLSPINVQGNKNINRYRYEGVIEDGIITIPSGELFADQTYDIYVVAKGYDFTPVPSFSSNGSSDAEIFLIELDPLKGSYEEPEEEPESVETKLLLMDINNFNVTGERLVDVRTIELTFNKDIEVNKSGLKYQRLSELLGSAITENTDNDDNEIKLGTTADPLKADDFYAKGLNIIAEGNTLRITLSATDEELTSKAEIEGTYDADDYLVWDLAGIYAGLEIRVKDASTETNWKPLASIGTEVETIKFETTDSIKVSDTAFIIANK